MKRRIRLDLSRGTPLRSPRLCVLKPTLRNTGIPKQVLESISSRSASAFPKSIGERSIGERKTNSILRWVTQVSRFR